MGDIFASHAVFFDSNELLVRWFQLLGQALLMKTDHRTFINSYPNQLNLF
jgi:hypothetical protein